jgi:hypothetical protein
MKKRAGKAPRVSAEAPKEREEAAWWPRIEAFVERRAAWLAVGLVLLAAVRIVSTYTVFSHTFDEPAHIACGMEWIEKRAYTYETQHPPLARVMTAVLPKLAGARGADQKSMWDEGLAILFREGKEDHTLALARAGILPFFWIACWIAYSCARWISGRGAAAVAAVLLVTMTPSLLAHGGLATTDMSLTAMLMLAIYTGWRWVAEPGRPRAAAFGASTGLAVLAKFSTFAFLPSVAVVALLFWWRVERPGWKRLAELARERAAGFSLAVLAAAVVVWAGYCFSFGKTPGGAFPVPAPELFSGIRAVKEHNASGHLTYLLGAVSTTGWPHFFLVALGVKTPLPVLALGICGLVLLCSRSRFGSRGWLAPSTVLGILVFSSFLSRIKIGTRHVLPVSLALGIAGGCAAVWMLDRFARRRLAQSAVGLTLLAVPLTSLAAHPDYLAYFNLLAGGKPEAVLVDSDLDWGQDIKKLGLRLKELGATEVYYNQFAPGDLGKQYGFPSIRSLDLNGPRPGWNAVNLTPFKYGLFGGARYVADPGIQFWPDLMRPYERVGGGILLFYSSPKTR